MMEIKGIGSLFILAFDSNNDRYIVTIDDNGDIDINKDAEPNIRPLVFTNKDEFIEWYKESDIDFIGYISYEDQTITHIDVALYEYHNGFFDYEESTCPREIIEDHDIEYGDIL